MGMISVSLIRMLLRVVINKPVFVFKLGCVSQTICFRVLYNTCFVITMTLRWCNLFVNRLWNVVTYDMLCWITMILVVCKLDWNPSRFQLTTGFIWAQVWEFDRFGDCFCTCALINWSVLWQLVSELDSTLNMSYGYLKKSFCCENGFPTYSYI